MKVKYTGLAIEEHDGAFSRWMAKNFTEKQQPTIFQLQEKFHCDDPMTALALEYHRRTEHYDASVCRERRDGIAIPVLPAERAQCTRNAHQVAAEMFAHYLSSQNVTKAEWQSAIKRNARLFESMLRSGRITLP